MKNIILRLMFMGLGSSAFSQGPPPISATYDPNWDWTDPSANFTIYTLQNPGGLSVGNPFYNGAVNSDIYANVQLPQDFKKNQGWVLLSKDFGSSTAPVGSGYAYFMLYNKYRSIIRTLIYSTKIQDHTKGKITLGWTTPSANNSMLTIAGGNLQPYQNYVGNTNNKEYLLNTISNYMNGGAWIMTDFPVSFDPNTEPTKKMTLTFDLNSVDVMDVALSGTFNMITQTQGVTKPEVAQNADGSWSTTAHKNINKYLGMIPSETAMKDLFTSINTNVDNLDNNFCNDFTNKLFDLNDKIQNGKLKEGLLNIADFVPGAKTAVKMAFSVIDFFSGKGSNAAPGAPSQYIQPTISTSQGELSLSGTITGTSTARTFYLEVPGTYHHTTNPATTENFNANGLPFYDCPLGTVALKALPKILVRDTYLEIMQIGIPTVIKKYTGDNCGHPGTSDCGFTETVGEKIDYVYEKFKSYKIDSELELALNIASGVVIDEVDAAIICEKTIKNGIPDISGQRILNYDLFSDPTTVTPTSTLNMVSNLGTYSVSCDCSDFGHTDQPDKSEYIKGTWKNYERDNLNNGYYKLVKPGNYIDNNYPRFSTPLIPIDQFKNTSITVRATGSKMYLKLSVKMHPSDPNMEQTPIYYVTTYEIPDDKLTPEPANHNSFPLTCNQLIDLPSGAGKYVFQGPINLAHTFFYKRVNLDTKDQVNFFPINNRSQTLQADNEVHFSEGTHILPSITNSQFHALISSSGTCESIGSNGLIVTPFFENCNNITHRMMSTQNSNVEIANAKEEIKVLITPNPNNGNFTLNVTDLKTDESETFSKVSVFNSIGAMVLQNQYLNGTNHIINIENVSPGIYTIVVQNTMGVKTVKIVKQ